MCGAFGGLSSVRDGFLPPTPITIDIKTPCDANTTYVFGGAPIAKPPGVATGSLLQGWVRGEACRGTFPDNNDSFRLPATMQHSIIAGIHYM